MTARWNVHIGMFKTGTTALQDQFAASREGLKKTGILYPSTSVVHGRHAGLVLSMVDPNSVAKDTRRTIGPDTWHELLKAIDNEASESDAILLSAENFSSFPPETFASLLHEMRQTGGLKVLTLIRDQVSAMTSMYRHVVRSNGFVRTFGQFVNDQFQKEDQGVWRGQLYDLDQYLGRWYELVGDDLIVGVYDTEARRNIGRLVLGLLGLDGVELQPPPTANVGLDGPFVAAARELNRLLDGDAREKAMSILLELQNQSEYQPFAISSRLRNQITTRYKEGNKRVADRFFPPDSAPSWLYGERARK